MALGVHIITDFMAMEPLIAWELLQKSHPCLLTGPRVCYCGECECTLDNVRESIRRQGKPHVGISFEQNTLAQISYGHIRNFAHSLVSIDRMVSDATDAWQWAEPFAARPEFRQAWVFDSEFNYWQNADDPLEYEAAGRSYEGLPMKSNDLPFPLEQMIIDTSENPGRRVLRQGYVEAVGAVMWFGEQLWRVTSTRKEDVIAQDWLRCEELPSRVLRIQAFDQPFTTAEDEEGRLQNRLRALLFPGQD